MDQVTLAETAHAAWALSVHVAIVVAVCRRHLRALGFVSVAADKDSGVR